MREDLEHLEINQQAIGMKHLFRGFSSKAWKEPIFMEINTTYNAIVTQHFMNYCCKCRKDINEKLHDEAVQRKSLIEWQQNEYEWSLEGQHPQVQKIEIEQN